LLPAIGAPAGPGTGEDRWVAGRFGFNPKKSGPVIEHKNLIGSTLPFPNQPGSRLQLGTSVYGGRSDFLELLCNPAELALRLWAEGAQSDSCMRYATARTSNSRLRYRGA
jgi:hypothetical protein